MTSPEGSKSAVVSCLCVYTPTLPSEPELESIPACSCGGKDKVKAGGTRFIQQQKESTRFCSFVMAKTCSMCGMDSEGVRPRREKNNFR